jgi:hypothetical protein
MPGRPLPAASLLEQTDLTGQLLNFVAGKKKLKSRLRKQAPRTVLPPSIASRRNSIGGGQ